MIKIISLNANTSVNLINGQPDLSAFQEPSLSILQAAFDDGNYEVIPDVVPMPIVLQPDWVELNNVCLGGVLNSMYNRLTAACFIDPATATLTLIANANNIAVGKGLMDQSVAVTKVEGAVRASIDLILSTSSYTFSVDEKALWNSTVESLGFSSLIHI